MTVFSLAVKCKAGVLIQERLFFVQVQGLSRFSLDQLIAHFRRLLLEVFQLLGISAIACN